MYTPFAPAVCPLRLPCQRCDSIRRTAAAGSESFPQARQV